MMDLGLCDKVALVTAASRGLGRAVALRLAQEGAHVAICARNEGVLRETAAEIEAATGRQVLALPAASRAVQFSHKTLKPPSRGRPMQRFAVSGECFRPQNAPGTGAESTGKLELNSPAAASYITGVSLLVDGGMYRGAT